MNCFAIRSTSGTSRPPSRVQTAGSNVWGQPGGVRAPASVASSQTRISSANQGLEPASLEDDLGTSISAAVSKRKSREESDEDYLKLPPHEIKRLKAEAAEYAAEYDMHVDELVKFVEVCYIFKCSTHLFTKVTSCSWATLLA